MSIYGAAYGAARRIGLAPDEYAARRADGWRICQICRDLLPRTAFRSPTGYCRDCGGTGHKGVCAPGRHDGRVGNGGARVPRARRCK